MNIEKIITEEINNFINETILFEKKKAEKDISKKGKKLRNGKREDFDVKADKKTNPNINNQDAEDLSNVLNSPYTNVSAIAQKAYPGLTPQGAQSKLRKKAKHLKSDSGTPYKFKKKEANKIRRIIDSI